jgi:hypothetical protein
MLGKIRACIDAFGYQVGETVGAVVRPHDVVFGQEVASGDARGERNSTLVIEADQPSTTN